DNRVAGLKEKAAASLDAKVDAAMPDKPSAADEEGVAIIGMFNFDESAQEKLDILEGLLDNVKPKNLGRKVLHMVSGQPAPEKWTTDEEISAAIRDFTATIDQVSQHGVNDTVREAIAEHVSRYGLLYPSAEDYVNLAERSIKEVAHLFDPGTTKKAVIEHLETTTISMLRDMGYVTVEKEETPTEEPQSAEESGPKRIELDVAVMQEINNRIKELRDKGFPDKRIFKKLSPYYHPDTTQLPREYFQYFESRFRDSDE
ncbi:MAG: hypothetical protein JWP13_59, partial [Candidatus Saccharibacteria bacterium]|nr:hypothetical protein [Candidatus Saccharibacteria bacterium]